MDDTSTRRLYLQALEAIALERVADDEDAMLALALSIGFDPAGGRLS